MFQTNRDVEICMFENKSINNVVWVMLDKQETGFILKYIWNIKICLFHLSRTKEIISV